MTRILQIRRGTTAQNNNFTGLPGELSFDTETKNLRVHDGATLGGFAMARADQSGGGGEFDINSVPATFWQNIVETYAPKPLKFKESNLATIANNSYLDAIFDIDYPIRFAQVVLVCQTPEAGYSIDDAVGAFGIGARANPQTNIFSDNFGMHARLMVGGDNFWVCHKNTGARTEITNSKWKAKFTICY